MAPSFAPLKSGSFLRALSDESRSGRGLEKPDTERKRVLSPRSAQPRVCGDEVEFDGDRSRQLLAHRAVSPVSGNRDAAAQPPITQLFGWGKGGAFS